MVPDVGGKTGLYFLLKIVRPYGWLFLPPYFSRLLILTRPTAHFAAPRLYPTRSVDVKAERKKKKKISLPHPHLERALLLRRVGSLRRRRAATGRPAVRAALFPRQPPAASLFPPSLELPPFSLPTSSSLPLQRGDGGGKEGSPGAGSPRMQRPWMACALCMEDAAAAAHPFRRRAPLRGNGTSAPPARSATRIRQGAWKPAATGMEREG